MLQMWQKESNDSITTRMHTILRRSDGMRKKTCKECDKIFELETPAQQYHNKQCAKKARKRYIRNKVRKLRDVWIFNHSKNKENKDDRIQVTYHESPGLHEVLIGLAKTHKIIGLTIAGDRPGNIGIVVAESSSEEE